MPTSWPGVFRHGWQPDLVVSIGTRYPEADDRLAATFADLVLDGNGARDPLGNAGDASDTPGVPPRAE
jgi:hypothetical protein